MKKQEETKLSLTKRVDRTIDEDPYRLTFSPNIWSILILYFLGIVLQEKGLEEYIRSFFEKKKRSIYDKLGEVKGYVSSFLRFVGCSPARSLKKSITKSFVKRNICTTQLRQI